MTGETDLVKLLKSMKPVLQEGDYVFCTLQDVNQLSGHEPLCLFREKEGITVIIEKQKADQLKLPYTFVAAWITLTVHSSLEAVGLTAAFAKALADEHISCNVVAAFYHDHIFVPKKDREKAMDILNRFSM